MERVVDGEINRKSEGIGGFSMFTSHKLKKNDWEALGSYIVST